MVTTSMSQGKKVCVIGAGPSGLVTARELRKEGHNVVVMEQNHDIGGQWLYESKTEGEDPLGRASTFLRVHSSMYESLRLQSPREIMGYTDFPFVEKKGRDMRRFPSHREVYLYLKDFCEFFELRGLIRFNTRVEYVGILDDFRWVVKTKEVVKGGGCCGGDKVVEEVFDAVVVASGHYSHPRLPTIKGMDKWKRRQMHSHVYRVPEPFKNEVVVIVGCSLSGQDISMELAGVATHVYVSVKLGHVTPGFAKIVAKHHNLHLRPQIECVEEDGRILFVDGSWIIADTIIYCTGYSYTFPFLDTKGIVNVDDDRVGPLYEHTFPPSLAPSLSFVGIPRKLIGFPFFEAQGKWVAQLLSGKRRLPTWEEMMKSINEFYQSKDDAGIPKHNTHDLASFEYCDKYGDNIGFPHLEEWKKQLCLSALQNAEDNLETFRDVYDDFELLQIAHQSPHFTQLGPEAFES
ncbi:hypothetical protein RND81_10G215600 [Saponaria officinalis]|uniref:Flavin-containing monooxygenase n=1 Tax=Saponaria officinalis TaxID=3572 RepID=A0AAW1I7C1_SAPOF